MPKLVDSPTDGLMIQFIGKPGSGKSIAAASFPKPMYIFDLESRLQPLKTFYSKEELSLIDYDTYFAGDLERFIKKLESFQRDCPYKTISIDGLTPLADMHLQYGISLRGNPKNKSIIQTNEIADYNVETRGILHIIAVLRELPKVNRILISHLLESEAFNIVTNQNTITQKTMTGGNKVSAKIPAFFNEVWNFYTKESAVVSDPPMYCMSAYDKGFGLGKTCINGLPKEIVFTKGVANSKGNLFEVLKPYLMKSNLYQE